MAGLRGSFLTCYIHILVFAGITSPYNIPRVPKQNLFGGAVTDRNVSVKDDTK